MVELDHWSDNTQSETNPSDEELANILPSFLQDRLNTQPVCPARFATCCPALLCLLRMELVPPFWDGSLLVAIPRMSKTFICLSSPPVMMRDESGEKVAERMLPACAVKVKNRRCTLMPVAAIPARHCERISRDQTILHQAMDRHLRRCRGSSQAKIPSRDKKWGQKFCESSVHPRIILFLNIIPFLSTI